MAGAGACQTKKPDTTPNCGTVHGRQCFQSLSDLPVAFEDFPFSQSKVSSMCLDSWRLMKGKHNNDNLPAVVQAAPANVSKSNHSSKERVKIKTATWEPTMGPTS